MDNPGVGIVTFALPGAFDLNPTLGIIGLDSFTGGSTDPGTSGTFVGSQVIATVVPEPGSSVLLLMGIGMVLVMRKRLAKGHQLAC
jgi:hypothetical protein